MEPYPVNGAVRILIPSGAFMLACIRLALNNCQHIRSFAIMIPKNYPANIHENFVFTNSGSEKVFQLLRLRASINHKEHKVPKSMLLCAPSAPSRLNLQFCGFFSRAGIFSKKRIIFALKNFLKTNEKEKSGDRKAFFF
jgi:hypothetical protein